MDNGTDVEPTDGILASLFRDRRAQSLVTDPEMIRDHAAAIERSNEAQQRTQLVCFASIASLPHPSPRQSRRSTSTATRRFEQRAEWLEYGRKGSQLCWQGECEIGEIVCKSYRHSHDAKLGDWHDPEQIAREREINQADHEMQQLHAEESINALAADRPSNGRSQRDLARSRLSVMRMIGST
jgi:hypothetical protein